MKMIILAAGEGKRLRPLTNDMPKCMVKYKGRSIIDYILEVATECKIKDIAVVNGYKKEILQQYLHGKSLTFFTNESYAVTNMVSTLFSAKNFMDDDLIISYADIIYTKKVLKKLLSSKDDLNVVVDREWKKLWSKRMENPLDDAETLKINDGKIIEIGKKPKNYIDIEGQYIGLIKVSKRVMQDVIQFYEALDKTKMYDDKDFNNIYMTSFIQLMIDELLDVKPVFINGGWIEIDTIGDLEVVDYEI